MPSQKGKDMILINNFAYQRNYKNKDNYLWKCQEYKKIDKPNPLNGNVNDDSQPIKLKQCMAVCHTTLDMQLLSNVPNIQDWKPKVNPDHNELTGHNHGPLTAEQIFNMRGRGKIKERARKEPRTKIHVIFDEVVDDMIVMNIIEISKETAPYMLLYKRN